MSTGAFGGIDMLVLDQPAAAIAKNHTVNLGYRPVAVIVINYKAAGHMAVAIDGLNSTVAGGLSFGRNAAMVAVGADGITFHENGIKLGQDASLITDNNAKIVILAFRTVRRFSEFDLSDAKATLDPIGGKQFTKDSDVLSEVSVSAD